MSIALWSIRRPVTTIMLFVSMGVIGLIVAFRLPLEMMPEATAPALFVSLPYADATPDEVVKQVIRPVEETLATMPGIQSMTSQTDAAGGQVQLKFSDWGRNVAIAASQARVLIDAVKADLPSDLRRYQVQFFSSGELPSISLRLDSDEDLSRRSDLIDRDIVQRLQRLPGVTKVEVEGIAQPEVLVALDRNRLIAQGVALNELVSRLQAANFSVSAGVISEGGRRLRVQPRGELTDVQQLRDLPINDKGTRLSDVASVSLQPQRMDDLRHADGKPSVGVDIFKERSANLVSLSRDVRAEIEKLKADPAMRGIRIVVDRDQGKLVLGSLSALAEAGAIGLLLSLIVLYAFLRHWPSTLMVSLAIPICFIMTLGFMYFAGVSLNMLSMMGLLLAVGMLVDNAVVVVESIYQERERYPGQPWLASVIGTRHVAIALSAGTLCHCAVFLPMMFGEKNLMTIFLTQLAVTISVSLLASWLVAISLIPMVSARMKTPPALKSPFIGALQARYARMLAWVLDHRGWAVAGIAFITVASLFPMTHVGFGEGVGSTEVDIAYYWNGTYSIEEKAREVARVEAYVDANRTRFHVRNVVSHFSEEGSNDYTGISLQGVTSSAQIAAIGEDVRKGLPKSALAEVNLRSEGATPDGSFNLTGDSTQQLRELAANIVPLLAREPALRDVRIGVGNASSELGVQVDRERAARYGFGSQQVAQYVSMALRGSSLNEFRHGEREIPVNMRFAGADHYGIDDVSGLMLRAPTGADVPLGALARVDRSPVAAAIQRVDRQTMLRIDANLAPGVAQTDARRAIDAVLARVAFPPGCGYTYETGEFNLGIDGLGQLVADIMIALALVFIIMAAVFESLLFPLMIMSCVLFSIYGVFWTLWVTNTSFGYTAAIGVLVLMGVVVNNGIVMVEHINNLRRRGLPRTQALVEGSRERLRPILMTMGTAILAMIPLTIERNPSGNSMAYFSMARAIAGGLAFSTVVSLLFLPTIYAILDDIRIGARRLVRKARGLPEAVPMQHVA